MTLKPPTPFGTSMMPTLTSFLQNILSIWGLQKEGSASLTNLWFFHNPHATFYTVLKSCFSSFFVVLLHQPRSPKLTTTQLLLKQKPYPSRASCSHSTLSTIPYIASLRQFLVSHCLISLNLICGVKFLHIMNKNRLIKNFINSISV